MRALLAWGAVVPAVTAAASARADGTQLELPGHALERVPTRATPAASDIAGSVEPGYFNGLGTKGRFWEVGSDGTFSTRRVATERLAVGGFIGVTDLVGIVVRTDFGASFDTTRSGHYSLQGPLLSLGARLRSRNADTWLEFGGRLIPPWPSPNATDPSALRLALAATLASGQADDARWLDFASFGYQLYAAAQSRARFEVLRSFLMVGARYGGVTSLAPLQIRSSLGPQEGIVGNVFVDLFFGARTVWDRALNAEVGIHGEASLSSVWPGDATFPMAADVFVGWSPERWISARAFFGFAGAQGAVEPLSHPFGLSLVLYQDAAAPRAKRAGVEESSAGVMVGVR